MYIIVTCMNMTAFMYTTISLNNHIQIHYNVNYKQPSKNSVTHKPSAASFVNHICMKAPNHRGQEGKRWSGNSHWDCNAVRGCIGETYLSLWPQEISLIHPLRYGIYITYRWYVSLEVRQNGQRSREHCNSTLSITPQHIKVTAHVNASIHWSCPTREFSLWSASPPTVYTSLEGQDSYKTQRFLLPVRYFYGLILRAVTSLIFLFHSV